MVDKKKPSEIYPQVAECEKRLRNLIQDIINVGQEMFSSKYKLYMPDIFLMGVLNRSINLIDAILVLTSCWNYIAAGPLIRLHLDTLLRLSYLRAIKNRDAFILKILRGENVRKLEDGEGKKLTDARLKDYTRSIFSQIDKVYEETSRLVHFSNKHVFTSVIAVNETSGVVEFSASRGSSKWGEKDILSLLECTIAITEVILALVRGWILEKAQMSNSEHEIHD